MGFIKPVGLENVCPAEDSLTFLIFEARFDCWCQSVPASSCRPGNFEQEEAASKYVHTGIVTHPRGSVCLPCDGDSLSISREGVAVENIADDACYLVDFLCKLLCF